MASCVSLNNNVDLRGAYPWRPEVSSVGRHRELWSRQCIRSLDVRRVETVKDTLTTSPTENLSGSMGIDGQNVG